MNNEQVAYINKDDGLVCAKCYKPFNPLTDEEINAEMLAYLNSKTMGLEDFAKAILRKAQE
jgi:Zn-finger protein